MLLCDLGLQANCSTPSYHGAGRLSKLSRYRVCEGWPETLTNQGRLAELAEVSTACGDIQPLCFRLCLLSANAVAPTASWQTHCMALPAGGHRPVGVLTYWPPGQWAHGSHRVGRCLKPYPNQNRRGVQPPAAGANPPGDYHRADPKNHRDQRPFMEHMNTKRRRVEQW